MRFRCSLVVLIMLLCTAPSFAQEVYPDCTHPKTIIFPFTSVADVNTEDEIYYQPEDKYTYWYKIEVKLAGKLVYGLIPIDSEDDYELLLYNYKGNNFCNDLVKRKVESFSKQSSGELVLIKNDVLYIGVLHLKGNGCGHNLILKSKDKSITIKAIQNECIEEAMTTMIEENVVYDTIKKPEIKVIYEELTSRIIGHVVNLNTQQNIEAEVSIFDLNNNQNVQLTSSIDSGFVLINVKEQTVVVSINKFGYHPFLDTLKLDSINFKIELTPIKIGEKLIMHKIYFYPNTYALKDESKQELILLKNFMLENGGYKFEIQGHTNGNKNVKKIDKYVQLGEEWNFSGGSKKLSKLRAEKIKSYLVTNGVNELQLQAIGYGGDKMIVTKPKNMKEAMKNIRVEVIVLQ